MVRPYQKPSTKTVTQFWCPNCEEWRSRDACTEGTYYMTDGDYIEAAGDYYYEGYTSYEIWSCDDCGEAMAGPDGTPDTRQITGGWVCAECKTEYEDSDSANECCN